MNSLSGISRIMCSPSESLPLIDAPPAPGICGNGFGTTEFHAKIWNGMVTLGTEWIRSEIGSTAPRLFMIVSNSATQSTGRLGSRLYRKANSFTSILVRHRLPAVGGPRDFLFLRKIFLRTAGRSYPRATADWAAAVDFATPAGKRAWSSEH